MKMGVDERENEARFCSGLKFRFVWRTAMNSGENRGWNREIETREKKEMSWVPLVDTYKRYFGKITSLPFFLWTRLIWSKRGSSRH